MGVPALFRWLSKKYPKIIEQVIEENPTEVNGVKLPVDISKPNPNNIEFDNLYLDMNGIIHPCCHPDNKPAPATEEDMMVEIMEYTERIVAMIRPRKVLYLAIDGVAPRAKMNQQRSRRFRTAQEAKEKAEDTTQAIEKLEASGQSIDQEVKSKKSFDSNCITPGTPFMAHLAVCLRYWIADKLNTEPGWKNLKVILSDASVPGEGEHKIMNFIRAQRASPYHDPNTRHVIYGLDADLIMLSLVTHEPHFKVLREDIFFQEGIYRACFICGQSDHMANQCTGRAKQKQGLYDEKGKATAIKPYIFLNVQVLREYLEIELKVSNIPWPFNLENAIDDWVFLCFFVGNDFLPHLPSLEIREGAIDTLITIWKRCLPLMGGYLTNNGNVDLKRLQYLVTDLGKQEDEIFIRRHRNEQRRAPPPPPQKRRKTKPNKAIDVYQSSESSQNEIDQTLNSNECAGLPHLPIGMPLHPVKGFDSQLRAKSNQEIVTNRQELRIANISAAQSLKAELNSSSVPVSTDIRSNENVNSDISVSEAIKQDTGDKVKLGAKRKADKLNEEIPITSEGDVDDNDYDDDSVSKDSEDVVDSIKLWEPGFKERYYKQKFDIDLPDEFQKNLMKSYIEGLSWVLQYYYQGVPSWKWYYPYHYSPFASDFVDIGDIQIKFELGEPFKPFEQLMGVLPAQSKEHLPVPFHKLMTDKESDIIDFYPETFKIDLNGKKYAWQGVALLPFIDESRLLKAIESVYPQLTTDEIMRNTCGSEVLCFSNSHKLYNTLCSLYSNQNSDKVPLDPTISDKMIGFVSRDPNFVPKSTFRSPLIEKNMPDFIDRSLRILYYLPAKTAGNVHKSILLRNVRMDPPVLGWEDHECLRSGSRGRGRGRGRGSPRDAHHDNRTHYDSRTHHDNRTHYDNRAYHGSRTHYDNRTHHGSRTHYDNRTHHDNRIHYDNRTHHGSRTHYDNRTHHGGRTHYDNRTHHGSRTHHDNRDTHSYQNRHYINF